MDSCWAEIPWLGREAHRADANGFTREVPHLDLLGLQVCLGILGRDRQVTGAVLARVSEISDPSDLGCQDRQAMGVGENHA